MMELEVMTIYGAQAQSVRAMIAACACIQVNMRVGAVIHCVGFVLAPYPEWQRVGPAWHCGNAVVPARGRITVLLRREK